MAIKKRNPSRAIIALSFLICTSCTVSRFLSAPPESLNKSGAELIPLFEKFKEVDTNNDNVIDEKESMDFLKKKQEEESPSALLVVVLILAASLLACLCSPAPAKVIKDNLFILGRFVKNKSKSLTEWIKAKTKK